MATRSSPRQWRSTPAEATRPNLQRFRRERWIARLVASAPIGAVRLGERFIVETRNAFGGDFSDDEDLERFMLRDDRRSMSHACTGPIEVAGVGDDASLVVSLRRVVARNALSCLSSSTGYLRGAFPGRRAHVHALDERGMIELPGVLLRGAASLGMIATLDDQDRSPGRCSENGGNLDLPCLGEGAKIYLPVNHARAQLALGDLHFRQGAAEVSGMGLEADGEVEIELDVAEKLPYPVIETELAIAVVGWGAGHPAAARSAVENMLHYLRRLEPFAAWAAADLYQLLGGFDLISGNATGSVATCAQTLSKRDLLDPSTRRSLVLGPDRGEAAKRRNASVQPARAAKERSDSPAASAGRPRATGLSPHQLLAAASPRFPQLPLIHCGASREIRSLPEVPGVLVSRLNPVVHSWLERGSVSAPDTPPIRARLNARFSQLLHEGGVRTSTLATLDEYVLMSEECVASTIEVVFKSRFSGSPKHRYRSLPSVRTLDERLLEAGSEHAPYVRFDWRNAPPLEDEVLPEGLARQFIDVAAATATALRAFAILNEHLRPRALRLIDGCLFMNKDGRVICGEVSPDNLGIEYTGADPLISRMLRDRDKARVAERWSLLAELAI